MVLNIHTAAGLAAAAGNCACAFLGLVIQRQAGTVSGYLNDRTFAITRKCKAVQINGGIRAVLDYQGLIQLNIFVQVVVIALFGGFAVFI